MHTYDPSRQPYPSQIPGMRPSREPVVDPFSLTPIYDTLYTEYRRAFRALPGDRTGEEDLDFKPFGNGLSARGLEAVPQPQPGTGWQPYPVPRPQIGHHPALPPAPRRGD
ncbi:hypothetical protein ACFVIM_25820 [Streptomyces sp. NPDC057638]|uniref:hypothetical protein n=1 Tax=Streptomyces sp. NPDC057638 TaxID=3346190 RepID=UPI0036ADCB13